jgi:hypothetical protein
MDWNQIETKWAVMARRIRADVRCGTTDDGTLVLRRVGKDESGARVVVTQTVSVTADITQKREPMSTR